MISSHLTKTIVSGVFILQVELLPALYYLDYILVQERQPYVTFL